MTLLPPIPPANLLGRLDSPRKITEGSAGAPTNGMPAGFIERWWVLLRSVPGSC